MEKGCEKEGSWAVLNSILQQMGCQGYTFSDSNKVKYAIRMIQVAIVGRNEKHIISFDTDDKKQSKE